MNTFFAHASSILGNACAGHSTGSPSIPGFHPSLPGIEGPISRAKARRFPWAVPPRRGNFSPPMKRALFRVATVGLLAVALAAVSRFSPKKPKP